MFQKILVPLDGSELAAQVLPLVKDLAAQLKARVTLITVGSADICDTGGAAPPCPETQVAKYLEKTAADLQTQGVAADWVYRRGQPAREIVMYADENRVDLIALATHGAGEIAWGLGSVAKKVISHAPGSVLLVRVMEPKAPALKSEMFYSLQTP